MMRRDIEVLPLEMALTWLPGKITVVCINHGRPRQIKILKMFEPTALETAMLPHPFLVTATELNRAGMDTAAATNVNPMTASGIFNVVPIIVIIHT